MWEREWADPSSSQCPKPAEPDTSSPFLGCSSFSLPSFFPPSYTYLLATLDSRSRNSWHLFPFLGYSSSSLSLSLPLTLAFCKLWTAGAGLGTSPPFLAACHSPTLLHLPHVNFGQQEQEPDTDLPPFLAASHPPSHTAVHCCPVKACVFMLPLQKFCMCIIVVVVCGAESYRRGSILPSATA